MLKCMFLTVFLAACGSLSSPDDLAATDLGPTGFEAQHYVPAPSTGAQGGAPKLPCYHQQWDACNPVPTRTDPASRPVPLEPK